MQRNNLNLRIPLVYLTSGQAKITTRGILTMFKNQEGWFLTMQGGAK